MSYTVPVALCYVYGYAISLDKNQFCRYNITTPGVETVSLDLVLLSVAFLVKNISHYQATIFMNTYKHIVMSNLSRLYDIHSHGTLCICLRKTTSLLVPCYGSAVFLE